jgi:hypothetical protein
MKNKIFYKAFIILIIFIMFSETYININLYIKNNNKIFIKFLKI